MRFNHQISTILLVLTLVQRLPSRRIAGSMSLHHDWPHHLLVFMSQNVAVVHEPRILQQVFFRHCEKSATWICLCLSKLLIAHMGHCPANPHNRHVKGIYPHCLLVASQIFWNFRRHIGTNVAMTATHPTICRGSLSIYTTVPVASL